MNIEFESQDILKRMANDFADLRHCVERVILPDGRIAEVKILVTTKEIDFCELHNMKATTIL